MILIGAHMSISGGVHYAIERGEELGCSAIQIFTKNSRMWRSNPYNNDEIKLFKEYYEKRSVKIVVAHNIYLVNLASEEKNVRANSLADMHDEMKKCDQLSIDTLIFHPGTHQDRKRGLKIIALSIDELYREKYKVNLTLETTAGQGNNLGSSFEELAEIIQLSEYSDKLKVCYDTCHTFTAGYDIRTEKIYNETFEKFDKIIGISKLVAFHINDTKYQLGSHRDRHDSIGEGEIGLNGFKYIMNDKRFQNIPKILETPKGDGTALDEKNLKTLRDLIEDEK